MNIFTIYNVENNTISLVSTVTNYLIGSQKSEPYVVDNTLYSTYDAILGGYGQTVQADAYSIVNFELLRQAMCKFDDITSESIKLLVNMSKIEDKSIKNGYMKRIQRSLDALHACDIELIELVIQYQTGCKTDNPKNLIEIQVLTTLFDFIDNYVKSYDQMDVLFEKYKFMLKKLHKIFTNNDIIKIQSDNVIWNKEFSRFIILVQDVKQIILHLEKKTILY